MDKNTIWGLVVMAAVFFAFMYFSPRDKQPTDNVSGQTEQSAAQAEPEADPLTQTDYDFLRANLRDNGTPVATDGGSRAYTLTQGPVSLRLDGDSVSGTVTSSTPAMPP